MGLRRPNEFTRKGRRLPGQSSDESLGLERALQINIRVYGDAAVWDQELLQIGNIGKGDYIELGPDGIKIFNSGTEVQNHAGAVITIGNEASGNYLQIDEDGISIYNNGTLTHTYDDTTAVINQDTVQIGDVTAGNYIQISADSIEIHNEGAVTEIWSDADGNAAQTEFRVTGDASNNEAWIGLVATNYGSSTQVGFTLDTQNDRATVSAGQLLIGSNLRLSMITTTQRDALTAVNGMIIYNLTTSKFQGYAGGSWVDLH